MTIYIIIPAYNEEKRIGETLQEYCNFFGDWTRQIKIIVAINNTTDKTESIVKSFQKRRYSCTLSYLNLPGAGKGYAIIEGWKEALKTAKSEDYIGFVDADCATSPEAYDDLIKKLDGNPGLDGAIASRYIHGAVINPKQTWQRVLVSRVFNLMIRCVLFLPYNDTQCGAKLFRRDAIFDIQDDIGLTKWACDPDMLFQLKRKGYKIEEFPTVWSDKAYSKINFMKAGPKMALAIIRLRLLYSPFKFIVRAYDIIAKKVRRT